jgi:NAD(P)H-hydrate epimerase
LRFRIAILEQEFYLRSYSRVATRTTAAQSIDEALALSLLPRRAPGDHKWGVGGLVIIGGAPGYIGAPALCARAAGRSGAGIVSVAVSRASVGPVATLAPEATFLPLPEGDAIAAASRALKLIRERVEQSAAIVVGPGLSKDEHAKALLAALFGMREERSGSRLGFGNTSDQSEAAAASRVLGGTTPAVVDADALNWLAEQDEWWDRVEPGSLVLTPHMGEMARLLDTETDAILADPQGAAVEAAGRWRQVVLLKGARAIVTDGESVYTGPETPPSLATAGSGDVLAGSIGAFMAQGLSLMDAAVLALHVGLEATQGLESEFGTLGLIASDLPDAIGRALAALERKRE